MGNTQDFTVTAAGRSQVPLRDHAGPKTPGPATSKTATPSRHPEGWQ